MGEYDFFEKLPENKKHNMTSKAKSIAPNTPKKFESNITKPLHLEDLMISEEEFWAKMIPKRGALKNFLTINKPASASCGRGGVLSEIVSIANIILAEKLKKV